MGGSRMVNLFQNGLGYYVFLKVALSLFTLDTLLRTHSGRFQEKNKANNEASNLLGTGQRNLICLCRYSLFALKFGPSQKVQVLCFQ